MPEYLTPGVYVEETSFRSRSIEGVATSTCGMAGFARYGPLPYVREVDGRTVTMVPEPPLITSVTEYERTFGDLERVHDQDNYLGFAARAFFSQGGRRLYVARAFSRGQDGNVDARHFAGVDVGFEGATTPPVLRCHARWPGQMAREISITASFRRSKNVVVTGRPGAPDAGPRLVGVQPGALVEVRPLQADGQAPRLDDGKDEPQWDALRIVRTSPEGRLGYESDDGVIPPADGTAAFHLRVSLTVRLRGRSDTYSEMELVDDHPRSVFNVLDPEDPVDETALVWLRVTPTPEGAPDRPWPEVLRALLTLKDRFLVGGSDGDAPVPADLRGREPDPDVLERPATGLFALAEVEDIAIVAAPDTVRFDEDEQKVAVDDLIDHCQRARYRIAVVDPPRDSSLSQVRAFRSKFDSSHAALYYPWVEIPDPTARREPGAPPVRLALPPSGYVAGIYARNDIARGVHKAPANEVVSGITRFLTNVTFDRQAVLNPEGINALRFFEGRSNRVWGARTMSSDPEWKYVNVRRLFIYLEHSIERSTQWAVFEPNNERLWASIRQSVEDFLLATWRTGALMGTKPEEAYFVRCDRTTMTQNDLDNGRLICLIGVAPTYPAEFVIFRIGQWTADAQRS